MARGGRVVYKKSNRRKRRKPRSNGDEDDDEEEYVVGEDDEDEDEDEESESNYESDAESDEESYEFSDSDEEKEIKNGRSKRGSKKVGNRKKTRVSDDDEMEDLRVPKKRGRGRLRKQESRDSDYEFDDEDEDDEDFLPDDDEFDKDEVLVGAKRGIGKKGKKRGRKKRNLAFHARKTQKAENLDEDDEDFVVKDRVSVGRKRKRGKIATKKRAAVDEEKEVSDFLASDEDDDDDDDDDDFVEKSIVVMKNIKKDVKKTMRSKGRRKKRSVEDSEYSDSDYVVSDDDFVEKSIVVVSNNKTVKKTSGSKGRRNKKSVEVLESSDSDYVIWDDDDADFDASDQIVLDKRQKKNKKENNVVVSSNRRKRRKSVVDSESSDSDYLMSNEDEQEEEEEDDFIVKDKFVMDKQHKKTSNTRKKRSEPKTRRKRSNSLVDSDLEFLDFDKEISEEEVKDRRVGWDFDWPKPKRRVMKKEEEEKGKEKKVDSGKQVCGICLSEEQNGIVRGLLDCCSHYFCFACIMEWSKVESRCPVCKRRFVTITKSGKLNPASGIRNTVIRVQMKDQVYQPSEEELRGMLDPYENVVCMECQQGGDDNLMLLCDICDSSAHTYCVGLGREVPEGNWYCECCRFVNEGLPHCHPQDTVTDEGANPSYLYSSVTERSGSNNARVDTNSPRPVSTSGRPPSLRIDLNASPRDLPGDDNYVASSMSGLGASTLSGRRHIHQRIRILISSSRQRQSAMRTSVLGPGTEANVVTPENALTEEALPSELEFVDWQQNHRPSLHSNASLVPCMFNEGSSFRHVEGAKEEVQSLVKRHLKNFARDTTLELITLKEVVKNSTHTILAACGINHHRSNVPISVDPPEYCLHGADDGPTHLVKNCCASCFDSFVEDVVQRLVNMSP